MPNPWDNDPVVGQPATVQAAPWSNDPVVADPATTVAPPDELKQGKSPSIYDSIRESSPVFHLLGPTQTQRMNIEAQRGLGTTDRLGRPELRGSLIENEGFVGAMFTPNEKLPWVITPVPEGAKQALSVIGSAPGLENFKLVAGIANPLINFWNGLTGSLGGLATAGIGPEIQSLKAGSSAAQAAVTGMEAGFAGQMGAQTIENLPQTIRTIRSDTTSEVDKVEAGANAFLGLFFATLAGRGAYKNFTAEKLAHLPAQEQVAQIAKDSGKSVDQLVSEMRRAASDRLTSTPAEGMKAEAVKAGEKAAQAQPAAVETPPEPAAAPAEGQTTPEAPMAPEAPPVASPEPVAPATVSVDQPLSSAFSPDNPLRPIQATPTDIAGVYVFDRSKPPEVTPKEASKITDDPLSSKQSLGITGIPPAVTDWIDKGSSLVKKVISEVRDDPKFTPVREAVNKFIGERQITQLEIEKFQKQVRAALPKKAERIAVTNYLQAGGDRATLETWAKASKNLTYRKGYEDALKLTPEQIKQAENLRAFYDNGLKVGQNADVLDEGLDNYVNQMWKKAFVGGETARRQLPGRLTQTFKFAKARTFGSFFEGEQAGFKPLTKDIGELSAIYANEMNKTIATRQLIADLTKMKDAQDGRPLAAPLGRGNVIPADEAGNPGAILVHPMARDEVTSDYRVFNHPALNKWKWVTEDNGKPVLEQGTLAIHPNVARHINAIIGGDKIEQWYNSPSSGLSTVFKGAVKLADRGSSFTKNALLGFLSPGFHTVQEGTHAVGHLVNPFGSLPKLDPASPEVQRFASHGLMIAGDNQAMQQFVDGFGHNNPLERIPGLGPLSKQMSQWLFHNYIPRLKLATAIRMEARNMKVYAKELVAGTVTPSDVTYLSAQQANAAYGHLNYVDLGRDPTVGHILRLGLLAPDFLEARGRFVGQALKQVVGNKAGREQFKAVALLAATTYLAARVLNKTLDDDWHFDEPFAVKVGDRKYTMRSVPEDLWRFFNDPGRFAYNRFNPLIVQGGMEVATGKNYRGEKVTFSDSMRDVATKWIPISTRWIPDIRNLTATGKNATVSPWEEFLGSVGLLIQRESDINDAYKLAGKFKRAQNIPEDTGVYPVSKYQQLRYALEDGDHAKARAALQHLIEDHGQLDAKLVDGFKASLFHPFTGTLQLDQKFKESLDEKGKATVEAAVKARQTAWLEFVKLVKEMMVEKQQQSQPAAN